MFEIFVFSEAHTNRDQRSSGKSLHHYVAADSLPNRGSVTQYLSHQPAVVPFW
jgi:hypothetical protein